jgi:hypothetical protein
MREPQRGHSKDRLKKRASWIQTRSDSESGMGVPSVRLCCLETRAVFMLGSHDEEEWTGHYLN